MRQSAVADFCALRLRPHRQLLAAARRAAGGAPPELASDDEDVRAPAPARTGVSAAGVVGPRGWPAITIGADAAFAERLVRELSALLGEAAD